MLTTDFEEKKQHKKTYTSPTNNRNRTLRMYRGKGIKGLLWCNTMCRISRRNITVRLYLYRIAQRILNFLVKWGNFKLSLASRAQPKRILAAAWPRFYPAIVPPFPTKRPKIPNCSGWFDLRGGWSRICRYRGARRRGRGTYRGYLSPNQHCPHSLGLEIKKHFKEFNYLSATTTKSKLHKNSWKSRPLKLNNTYCAPRIPRKLIRDRGKKSHEKKARLSSTRWNDEKQSHQEAVWN